MLSIQNVHKSFGGVKALDGSNFVVPKNKITALIGPNGAGKTTLFDIICGLTSADSGNILFDNTDITKLATYKIANLGISRTFQQVRLFRNLSIRDHLLMSENNNDTKLSKNFFKRYNNWDYNHLLEEFRIKKTLDTLVCDLSYGQRKLLQIAMAINKPHKILLLDEPVAGVNSLIQNEIENLLLKLKAKGETILLIDHDMNFVKRLSDHVIALDAGRVIVEGTPAEVLSDERVLEAYLGK